MRTAPPAFMYYAYAQDPEMKLNLGIRRRLAQLFANDARRIELLKALLLTLPGSPIIYYGDHLNRRARDGLRGEVQTTRS